MLHFNYSPEVSALLYNLFTTLGLIVPFVVAWYLGRKKGFPNATWLTSLALLNGLMILGTRLGAFRASDWQSFFQGGAWQPETAKTAVGGLLLALMGYQILKKWFKLPASAADVIMLVLPLGGAIARVGCLIAGCCYGTPTEGWWSVTFGPGSSAYDAQVSCGRIAADAAASLPVHPFQLDLIFSNLLIFFVLWRLQNRFRPGRLAIVALGLLAMGRFGTEFFRDTISNTGETGQMLLGMKAVQWISLLTASVCALLLWRKSKKQAVPQKILQEQPLLRLSWIVLPLSLAIWLFRQQMSVFENLALCLTFVPVATAILLAVWENEQKRPLRWSTTALVSGALVVQALVQADSLILPPKTAANQGETRSWWDFGGGYGNAYFNDYDAVTTGSGCNQKTTVYRDRNVEQQSGVVEAAVHRLEKNSHFAFGGRLGYANTNIVRGFPYAQGNFWQGGLFGSLDARGIGLNLGVIKVSDHGLDLVGAGRFGSSVNLTGGIRFGRRTNYSFDIQFRERQQFLPYRYPDVTIGLFNWGFRDPTGQTYFRTGIASLSAQSDPAWFAAARIPFWQRRMSVESGLYYELNNFEYYAFSLGLHYHFYPKNNTTLNR